MLPSSAQQSKAENLDRLVRTLLTRAGVREDTKQSCHGLLLSYAIRHISTKLAHSSTLDEVTVVQNIYQQLSSKGRREVAQRFVEMSSKLEKQKLMSNATRGAALHLLYKLSSHTPRQLHQQPPLLPTVQISQLALDIRRPRSSQGTSSSSTAPAQQQPYSVSLPPSVASSVEGPLRMFPPHEPLPTVTEARLASDGAGPQQKPHAGHPAAFSAKEAEVVRDVLWSSQGLVGQLTVLQGGAATDSEQAYQLRPGAALPAPELSLVLCHTELGWLFKKVKAQVDSGMEGQGVVRQAMCAALQGELKDFYRLMAVLEAQSLNPTPLPGDSEQAAGAPYLTLRRLSIWLAEPIRRMRLLATMGQATEGLRGGQLLGAVHAFSRHGDPLTEGFVTRVLHQCCAPLLEMVRGWVYEGLLHDPFQEFFIARNERLDGDVGAEMWVEGWSIVEGRLPPFISGALAQRILRCGKSIHFLQQVCGDRKWVQQRALSSADTAASFATALKVADLEAVVAEASKAVDERVMEVLMKRFHFAKHCEGIRRYLLFTQGDFVSTLIDQASEELDKDAPLVSEMSLAHCLRGAIAASSAKYDDEDVLDCLRVKRASAHGDRETGWEVFALQYCVEGPLQAVFTHSTMRRYLRVFQLLLAIKRVEAGLGSAWHLLKSEVEHALPRMRRVVRNPQGAKEIIALERRCLQLRNEMSHFVTNLQIYVMFEVLEGAWQEFRRKAEAAGDLDEVVAAHEEYLEALLHKALLGPDSEHLRTLLRAMFAQMLQLRPLVVRFSQAVQAAEKLLRSRSESAAERTARGQWGNTDVDDHTFAMEMLDELKDIDSSVAELERLYQMHLTNFTQALPAQTHVEVRFLLYRLDFSEYYNKRRSTFDADDATNTPSFASSAATG